MSRSASVASGLVAAALFGPFVGVGSALAQDAPIASTQDLAEMDLEELLGVVISASGEEESRALAPASVTVIDRATIRSRAAVSVPDLLRTVPGVQVMMVGPGNYVVSMRGTGGLQGNNVIVLLDGVTLNSPVDGNVDWSALPVLPNDIARIEVARGPVSPIFGANAYTGVISIETVRGPTEGGRGQEIHATGGVDQGGRLLGSVTAGVHGRAGRTSYALRASGLRDGTFAAGDDGAEPPLRRGSFVGNVDVGFSEHVRLDLSGGATLSSASAEDALVLEPGAHTARLGFARASLRLLELARSLAAIEIWGEALTYSRDAAEEDFLGFNYPAPQSVRGQLGVELALSLPFDIDVRGGFELGLIHVDAPFIHPAENGDLRLSFGGRLNAKVDLAERLLVMLAGRVDRSTFSDRAQVSYRGSLVYHQSTFSARLTVGTAYRNPTFVELGSRFRDPLTGYILLEGQSNLDVPRVESIEAALTMAGPRYTLMPTVYLGRTRDLIEGDFEPLVRKTFRNGDEDVALLGFELESAVDLTDRLAWELRGTALVFLSDTEDPNATVGTGKHNSRYTAWTGLRGRALDDRLILSGGALFVAGRDYSVLAGIPPRPLLHEVSPYVRLEATASYRPSADAPLFIRLAVVSHAPEVRESPLPSSGAQGTRVMLGLSYRPGAPPSGG